MTNKVAVYACIFLIFIYVLTIIKIYKKKKKNYNLYIFINNIMKF